MPGLVHFFGLQPSEVRALKVRELRAFNDYAERYRKAQEEAMRT